MAELIEKLIERTFNRIAMYDKEIDKFVLILQTIDNINLTGKLSQKNIHIPYNNLPWMTIKRLIESMLGDCPVCYENMGNGYYCAKCHNVWCVKCLNNFYVCPFCRTNLFVKKS